MKRPTVPQVLPKVREYYATQVGSGGGSLHIVLDDGNVEDSNVEFCIEYAKQNNDTVGEELAKTILQMTERQRWKLFEADK